jgi:hypothetical protein
MQRQMTFDDLAQDLWPAGPDDQAPGVAPVAWLGFTPDHTPDAARATFRTRWGAEPAELRTVPGALLVGPLPEVHP